MIESSSTRIPSTDATGAPALILMPFLGGSWNEWRGVMELLSPRFRCIGVDLPGFGEAAEIPGYSVAEMADYVASRIEALHLARFILIGHSMSAKVAMAIASRAAEGSALAGLVLLTASPPAPEPMEDKQRAKLIADLGTRGPDERKHAEAFIQENLAEELAPDVLESAVSDVLRRNPEAWVAWLEHGSREDWADRIGIINTPTLLLAGEEDDDLGAATQLRMVLPHLLRAQFEIVAGSSHLIPMEQPEKLAQLIADFVNSLSAKSASPLDPQYDALIHSDRVSARTLDVLLERAAPDSPLYTPAIFSSSEMTTLRALTARVIPSHDKSLDLAQRVDKFLASDEGRGWRYATLPPDAEAWKMGLASMEHYAQTRHDMPFAALTTAQQDALLEAAAKGKLQPGLFENALELVHATHPEHAPFSAAQMRRWFEEVRALLTILYVAHPATLAAMGYSGIADGSDSQHLTGFVQLGVGAKEAWEPTTTPDEKEKAERA